MQSKSMSRKRALSLDTSDLQPKRLRSNPPLVDTADRLKYYLTNLPDHADADEDDSLSCLELGTETDLSFPSSNDVSLSQNLPLTRHNLRQYDDPTALQDETSQENSMATSSKGGKNNLDANEKLTAYDICVNRKKAIPFPPSLHKLIRWVVETPRRSADPLSPNSKNVASEWRTHWRSHEKEALHGLNHDLSVPPRTGPSIIGLEDQDFMVGCVPKPACCENDVKLAQAIRDIGAPTNPRPNMTYGYEKDTEVFSRAQETNLRNNDIKDFAGIARRVWFPCFTEEWKSNSTGGEHYAASLQGARNGAAICHSLHQFYLACDNPTAPAITEAETCHFSATLDGSSIWLWVTWRRETEEGLTWESEVIEKFWLHKEKEVAEFRRMLRNIWDYAQGARLNSIKAALSRFIAKPPSPRKKPSSRRQSPVKQLQSPSTSTSDISSILFPRMTPPRPTQTNTRFASELTPPNFDSKRAKVSNEDD